jgi:FkbM family methyltransferase
MILTRLLRQCLEKRGYRIYNPQNLPAGIDLARDLRRAAPAVPIRTVFDIGANEGQTLASFSREFPEATVYTFEPVAATFEILKKNAAGLPRVVLENLALADSPGTREIVLSDNSHINSLHRAADASTEATRRATIQVDTVDAYCAARAIDRIDLLKIDTEGYEIQVCQGAERMLREGRVGFVLAEVDFRGEKTGHTDFCALSRHLAPLGYTTHAFYDVSHWAKNPAPINYCNALFARLGG